MPSISSPAWIELLRWSGGGEGSREQSACWMWDGGLGGGWAKGRKRERNCSWIERRSRSLDAEGAGGGGKARLVTERIRIKGMRNDLKRGARGSRFKGDDRPVGRRHRSIAITDRQTDGGREQRAGEGEGVTRTDEDSNLFWRSIDADDEMLLGVSIEMRGGSRGASGMYVCTYSG